MQKRKMVHLQSAEPVVLADCQSKKVHTGKKLEKMNSELSEIVHLDGFYSVQSSSMKTYYSVRLKCSF